MLTTNGIDKFSNGSEKATNELINKLKIKRTQDGTINRLMSILSAWSLEAAGYLCFGKRLGYLNENENEALQILRANRSIFYLSTHLKFSTTIYRYINLPKWNCLENSEIYIIKETVRLTNDAINFINNSPIENMNCLVQNLVSNKELSKSDVHVLIQSLFTDSLSTTIPVLVFSLYILATDPSIQQKAFEEVKNVLDENGSITNKKLDNLHYIKGLIKETLRLYPNGTEISRILMQDLNLSGYKIPAKKHVNLNMTVLFRSPKEFPNPLKVIPERWIRKENSYQKPHPFILTPFGHGSRTCMGRRFAEQTLQMSLAKIIYSFKIDYKNSVEPLKQFYNILIFPSDTRGLIFELR